MVKILGSICVLGGGALAWWIQMSERQRKRDTLSELVMVLRRMQEMTGCSDCDLVQMACINPACLLGMEKEVGRLLPGMRADMALFDKHWNCRGTILAGDWLWRGEPA